MQYNTSNFWNFKIDKQVAKIKFHFLKINPAGFAAGFLEQIKLNFHVHGFANFV